MPSAANVKIEKQIASENALPEATHSSPLRQAITVIEHKIRNLEKRKSKLESYRDLQRSGKDLNQDQKTAVSKYDEVVQTLEFARDLCKQFLGIAVVSEKEEKKRARKEANARSQAELTKIREVLLVQDALTNMGQDTIREDFLNGRNGAATLCPNDLKLLDDLYGAVTPKHEAGDPTAFMPQVQAAAEHLHGVVDGKQKEAFGATYSQIKEVIGKIHESGYLDQAVETYAEECVAPPAEPAHQQQQLQPEPVAQMNIEPIPVQQLESMNLNMQEQGPVQQQVPQQMEPPVQMQPVAEPIYYQPAPPAPRHIADVIGAGSFLFIQADELDTPPEQIPSQTFTNQTYITAPPPPIPMPSHFHQLPNAQPPPPQQLQAPPPQQQQQPPQNVLPPQPQQQPQQPPPAQVNAAPMQANNGIGEHHPETQQHDEIRQQQHPRGGNRHPQQRSNQPFYTNNNGYQNRPRNRNNGPRPNNNRNNPQ